jgi:hypothetical protein
VRVFEVLLELVENFCTAETCAFKILDHADAAPAQTLDALHETGSFNRRYSTKAF